MATQNPVEYEGTYPLPEAQLDRFLFKLLVGYPTVEQEQEVLARHDAGPRSPRHRAPPACAPVAGPADLAAATPRSPRCGSRPAVLAYIVALVRATRESPSLALGVSPRGAATLLHAAKAWAWLSGRTFVTPDEVKAVAKPALRHRILLRPELELEGATADGVLDGILATVPTPRCTLHTDAHGDVPVPTWRLAAVAAALAPILLVLPGNGWSGSSWSTSSCCASRSSTPRLAPAPSAVAIERTLPGVLSLGADGDVSVGGREPDRPHAPRVVRRRARAVAARRRPPRSRAHPVTGPSDHQHARSAPSRRGRFEIRDLTVRVDGPLGLAARQRTRAAPSVLRVSPAVPRRDEAELRINRARILEVGLALGPRAGGGHRVRAAARVLGRRRVPAHRLVGHRARTGRPIVRTYRAERNQTVLLCSTTAA